MYFVKREICGSRWWVKLWGKLWFWQFSSRSSWICRDCALWQKGYILNYGGSFWGAAFCTAKQYERRSQEGYKCPLWEEFQWKFSKRDLEEHVRLREFWQEVLRSSLKRTGFSKFLNAAQNWPFPERYIHIRALTEMFRIQEPVAKTERQCQSDKRVVTNMPCTFLIQFINYISKLECGM